MGWFRDTWKDLTGQTAAEEMSEASKQGADANLAFQREALDYMKEANAPALEMRNQALGQLGGILVGTPEDSPLYQAQLSNIAKQQENAQNTMAAQSAATGGLRGGNYQRALMESSFDADRARQNALAQAYGQQISGLSGLAGINTGAGQIGQQMSNMGNIAGMGITGAAQSGLNAQNAQMQNLLGLGGLGVGIAGLFSDERLKAEVTKIGEKNGLPWYSWKWNEKANELGVHGYSEGHLAGEVEAKYPEAVHIDSSGYKKVNYEVLNG